MFIFEIKQVRIAKLDLILHDAPKKTSDLVCYVSA